MALMARLSALTGRGSDEAALPEDGDAAPIRLTMIMEKATAAAAARIELAGAEIRSFDGSLESFAANAPLVRRTDMLVVEIDPDNHGALAALEAFASGPGARMANIIAFHGALGGIGTSMIATQAAQYWAESKHVLLIDLDMQRGNAALYLNLKPRLTISDLIEADDRLDIEFLKMVAERHQSGLSVIASPTDMAGLDVITPEFLDRLLDVSATNFDLIVLDMPGVWMDWTALAMQKADLIALVSQMTVSGVQQARRQLDVMEANGLGDRVRVVMNRMVPGLFGKYDTSEASTVLRFPVHFPLANDYPTVSTALDEGIPLKKVKLKARIDKELRQMADAMALDMATAGSEAQAAGA